MMTDTLELPAFLARPKGHRRPVQHDQPARLYRSTYKAPQRPDGERWERAERFSVYLQDEAPRIGCGRRNCWVIVGRKRVGLCADGVKSVISRDDWNSLARRAVRL